MKFIQTKWLAVLALLLITFAVLAGCNETTPPAVTDGITDPAAVTEPTTLPPETEVEVTVESGEQTDPDTTPSDTAGETEPPRYSCPLHPGVPCECATEEPTYAPTEEPTEEPTV